MTALVENMHAELRQARENYGSAQERFEALKWPDSKEFYAIQKYTWDTLPQLEYLQE